MTSAANSGTHIIGSIKSLPEQPRLTRPVYIWSGQVAAGSADARHTHPCGQLLFASHGVMSVVTRTCAFVVPHNGAVWVPRGVEHGVYYRQQVTLRSIYIDAPLSAGLPQRCRALDVSPLLRALIVEAIKLPPDYDVHGRAGRIMGLIVDEIASTRPTSLYAPLPRDVRLSRVCRSLVENPVEHQRLDDVARSAGMSRRTLTRAFRRETGMSFIGWCQHMRLLEAASLLSTGRSVTEVALEVGYHSPSSFTSMFRRAFGVTPSHYVAATRPESVSRLP